MSTSSCSCMGPNQKRIMDQMASRLSKFNPLRVVPQVSFIKLGTYKGIALESD